MKVKSILIICLAVVLLAVCITGVVVAVQPGADLPSNPDDDKKDIFTAVDFGKHFNGKINQWSKTLGTVSRNIPTETSNEGLSSRYPTYGTSLSDITDEEKDALIAESAAMFVSDTTYDSMDEQGNLYLNGNPVGKKLYKHTSSVGMYYGDVSDGQPAVVEKVTVTANEVRNYVTGIYAPAGEVVKVEISQDDLDAIGGSLIVVVGQVSHRNNVNNIWKARNDFSRMPIIANKFTVISTTAYVGNPLGGPVYIYPSTFGKTFSVTLSGGVKYAHYIHGQTTRSQVEEMQTYSAPYYDFEVWDLGVRLSGPKKYANYDYDNLVKVGDLWEKIIRTSRQVPCSGNVTISVGYIYDCFVAAGEAVTFQGGHSWINAPCRWMSDALNYRSMVTNGFWGTIHEFNHLYQSYGMESGKTNEVTNNATSLLSYVLYTDISSKRSTDDGDLGGGWNRYTDPSRSLRETIANAANDTAQKSLNAYADLLHAFGPDVFAEAARKQVGFGVDSWYSALSQVTDYNFTYYFERLLGQTLSEEVKALYDTADRTIFVPVATVYQTGRDYYADGKQTFVSTVRPYRIERGNYIDIDFNERLIVPDDFTFTIKEVTDPTNGTIQKLSDGVYRYTPDSSELSGTIKAVVKLTSQQYVTKDVTLTLEFCQYDKNQVDVYTYTYGGDTSYSDVQQAVSANFVGYTDMQHYKSGSTFLNKLAKGQIGVVQGKVYITQSANYAICLRSGRGNNTLYLAVNDPQQMRQVLSLNTDHVNWATEGEHVVDMYLNEGDYLYFKEITLSRHYANDAFTELGMANLSVATPVMNTVATAVLCTDDMAMPVFDFTSEEKYPRVYSASAVLQQTDSSTHKLVSANMSSWSDGEKIDNIFDGNPSTFYHNQQNNFVSSDNPFELVVDVGQIVVANSIAIVSRTSGQYNLPCTFALDVSLDGQAWQRAANFADLSLNGNKVIGKFADCQFRYYKLTVTDTKSQSAGNKYVTIASIAFARNFDGTEMNPLSLRYLASDKTSFKVYDDVSTFGKLVCGNGKVQFDFVGGGFSLAVRQSAECSVRVSVDDKAFDLKITSDGTKNKSYPLVVQGLENQKHVVTIEVLSGEICVDELIVSR